MLDGENRRVAETSVIRKGKTEMLVEASKRVLRILMLEHVTCFQSTILFGQKLFQVAYALVGAKALCYPLEFDEQKTIYNTHSTCFAHCQNQETLKSSGSSRDHDDNITVWLRLRPT